jgi:RHS repeat-associated protein
MLNVCFKKTTSPQGFNETADIATGDSDGLTDQTDDYEYDANGNMIKDANKSIISITYNHLNLPTNIVFSGTTNGTISYLYNAIGQKLRKKVVDATSLNTTDYLSGFQYTNATLDFFPHAEGYVKYTPPAGRGSGIYSYVFNYTDHLGNIRLSYGKDPSTNVLKVLEENHYYPFGLKHTNYNSDRLIYVKEAEVYKLAPINTILPTYKYKYNGKELQEELGLNMYDYGARNYDPALGRWMNVDPLAEKYPNASPYNYCLGNPINLVDPDGRAPMDPRLIFVNGYLMLGSKKSGRDYWLDGRNSSSFIRGASNFVNTRGQNMQETFVEYNPSFGSSAVDRVKEGYNYAMHNYTSLTQNMDKEKDSFNFVTHSMGTAFGEGMSKFLQDMGWKVENVIHINAFQAGDIKAQEQETIMRDETYTIDYQNTNDPVINFSPTASPGSIQGSDVIIREKSNVGTSYIHANPITRGNRFWEELLKTTTKQLEDGKNKN